MIPAAQFVMLGLDAVIIIYMAKMLRDHGPPSVLMSRLSRVCLVVAAVVTAIALFDTVRDIEKVRWNILLTYVAKRDLLIDTALATGAVLAGLHILLTQTPTRLAITFLPTSLLAYLEGRVLDGTLAPAWSTWIGLVGGVAAFSSAGVLFDLSISPGKQGSWHGESPCRRYRPWTPSMLISLALFSLIFAHSIFIGGDDEYYHADAILAVMAKAREDSQRWLAGTKISQSLHEAVAEYEKRYGIPPPPGFDRWYAYATENGSPIIDEFAQIQQSLLPFWGIPPAELRRRTTHMLETTTSLGGVAIDGGNVRVLTDAWVTRQVAEMVAPFAQWLPDMQLVFNLDDECRVSVPYERMQMYLAKGQEARSRLSTLAQTQPGDGSEAPVKLQQNFSSTLDPPWSDENVLDTSDDWSKLSPDFEPWYVQPLFYEWIATTCHPDSPARKHHWWNKKAACLACSAPHSLHGLLANWTLSGDLCHQPDLMYLHGTLLNPVAARPTHELYPIFSQSRLLNYNDLLYPGVFTFASSVQFDSGKAVEWQHKENALYWRGSQSEGHTATGEWQTFLRPRFIDMAKRFGASRFAASSNITIDAAFVGDFIHCDQKECDAVRRHFYGSLDAPAPPSVPFQDTWSRRHLIDMDGAAYSGRFAAFVQSGSLPYRAAIWRTWAEDRLHPFVHFVPLDVRLVRDLWRLVTYFGGQGEPEARAIATAGADWTGKALRKEDMRIYMFRLLLEWGRLIDDHREVLGHSVMAGTLTKTPGSATPEPT